MLDMAMEERSDEENRAFENSAFADHVQNCRTDDLGFAYDVGKLMADRILQSCITLCVLVPLSPFHAFHAQFSPSP